MARLKFSPLEMRILEALWQQGPSAIRQIQDAMPPGHRPAYTTIQTTIYRLERKGAVERVTRIGNADIFGALVTRADAQGRLIDDLLAFFGGQSQPVMAHLIEAGKLTIDDLREAEKVLRKHGKAVKK